MAARTQFECIKASNLIKIIFRNSRSLKVKYYETFYYYYSPDIQILIVMKYIVCIPPLQNVFLAFQHVAAA